MNSSSLAQSAYTRTAAIAPSLKDVEYRAFAEVTRQLKAHTDAQGFGRLAEAVHLNQRLWSLLAADVARDDNVLSDQLRAQIFYLFEFTRAHSAKVLAGKATTEVLVDINTAVMRGLRGEAARPVEPVA